MTEGPATMRDVARVAGVSVKTVSNVVNDYQHVSASTRARVLAAIEQLDYRMNYAARSLSLGRTGMITLAVPELRLPYFAELADEVIKAAGARGRTVLVEQTGGTREGELAVLASDRRRMTDGLLLAPVALRDGDVPTLEADAALVLLGERRLGAVPRVSMSNEAAARAVTEHLLARGRRRIALIGTYDPDGVGAGFLRTRGFLGALAAAGVEHDPARTGAAHPWTRDSGAAAMGAVLGRSGDVDGVFALNDALALGAMRTLYDAGLRVPEDVAVAGFDDVEEGRFSRPSLTTVEPGRAEIARRAVAALVDGTGVVPDEPVPFRLEVRESTGGR